MFPLGRELSRSEVALDLRLMIPTQKMELGDIKSETHHTAAARKPACHLGGRAKKRLSS